MDRSRRRRVPRTLLLLVALPLLAGATPARAHRCGPYNVLPGERKAVVLERCGEPWYREVVGWQTVDGYDYPIEELWYETPNGVHHVLTFVGALMTEESSVRKR
jgi:hypothetical protein